MRNIKLVLWLIIIGFVAVFLFQNQDIITATRSFSLDLKIDQYKTPELPNGIIYLICLLTGFFVAFFSCLTKKFKYRKDIKKLKADNDSFLKEISDLKSKLELLQGVYNRPDETVIETPDVEVENVEEPEQWDKEQSAE
jgi:uncharacterized integral membrane protein